MDTSLYKDAGIFNQDEEMDEATDEEELDDEGLMDEEEEEFADEEV